jgi:hypothetical protein
MEQLEFGDVYDAFVEKFKPKKTTDDCYTPENVYNAIRDYICNRFGYSPDVVVRPFWPGENYEKIDYPDGCLVLDNPPFSIFSKIIKFYCNHEINFFLFGPGLTLFGSGERRVSYIVTGVNITYKNGANIMTGFVHNLDHEIWAEACPELRNIIKKENDKNLKKQKKQVRKLSLPDEIVTAAKLQYFANHNTPFRVRKRDAVFVRKLDNMAGGIFGGGLFLNERAAAERVAAERATAERATAEWIQLSDREIELQKMIGAEELI